MINYKQLVKKTMPPEKEKTASRCIIGHYFLRPICNIVSIPFIEKKINPTIITILSGFFSVVAFFAFLVIDNSIGFWLGWFSILVWNILDGVDGNIARYNDQCSDYGALWDATTGWLSIISFYYGMGFVAFHQPGYTIIDLTWLPSYSYIILGSVTAMSWIFPRLVMHKKAGIVGKKSVAGLSRENYGFLKLLVFNITSINGGAAVIFLISYLLKLNALCMIFYCFISMSACGMSLYSLLNKHSWDESSKA